MSSSHLQSSSVATRSVVFIANHFSNTVRCWAAIYAGTCDVGVAAAVACAYRVIPIASTSGDQFIGQQMSRMTRREAVGVDAVVSGRARVIASSKGAAHDVRP